MRISDRRLPPRPLQVVAHTEIGPVRARIYAHSATAPERRAACQRPRTNSVAHSPSARVFTPAYDLFDRTGIGCLRSLGGWVTLPESFAVPAATRGRWVAFNRADCGEGPEGCDFEIDLFDLRARRSSGVTLNELEDPTCTIAGGGDCGAYAVGSIVVNRLGALAWIACPHAWRAECPRRKHAPYEVYVLDSRGKRRVNTGPGIDPQSLRLGSRGHRITWTRVGAHRSERLRGPPRRGPAGLHSRF